MISDIGLIASTTGFTVIAGLLIVGLFVLVKAAMQ